MAELKVWLVRERERRSGGVRNWNIICHMSMGSEDDIFNAGIGWGGGAEKQRRSEVEVEDGLAAWAFRRQGKWPRPSLVENLRVRGRISTYIRQISETTTSNGGKRH